MELTHPIQRHYGTCNLVVGYDHDYTDAWDSFISGGKHKVRGRGVGLLGGFNNSAGLAKRNGGYLSSHTYYAAIAGGQNNLATPLSGYSGTSNNCFIGGGYSNKCS